MAESELVRVNTEDRVAVITIDHPPVNAFDRPTVAALEAALAAAAADPEAKAVVITGAGQLAFVAGADINEFARLTTVDEVHAISRRVQELFQGIELSAKPHIAAINGVALGGGLELAMACHMRVIGDRAKVGQTEINLGIIPGWGGTQRLARLVGQAKAIELILTGDSITAQEAYRVGLVNKVVPGGEVLKTARDLARKIAQKGGLATAAALRAIVGGLDQPLEAGLKLEAERYAHIALSEDAREGAAAFLQKRQPVFKDR